MEVFEGISHHANVRPLFGLYLKVELVHTHLKRAKGRVDSQDEQLFQAVNILLTCEADGDRAALQTVAEKLHLQKETSWNQELKALEGRRGAVASPSEEQCLDHMINVLKQIQIEDEKDAASSYTASKAHKASSSKGRDRSPHSEAPVPPDDFKCPISLELMNDPVIVATGQVVRRCF